MSRKSVSEWSEERLSLAKKTFAMEDGMCIGVELLIPKHC